MSRLISEAGSKILAGELVWNKHPRPQMKRDKKTMKDLADRLASQL